MIKLCKFARKKVRKIGVKKRVIRLFLVVIRNQLDDPRKISSRLLVYMMPTCSLAPVTTSYTTFYEPGSVTGSFYPEAALARGKAKNRE